MAARKRVDQRLAGDREAQAIAATLGAQAAASRRGLRLRQATVAARSGISRGRLGDLERGRGEGAPLGLWVALGLVLGRPLRVEFSRRVDTETADAGHLAIQELVLRLGRAAGYGRGFEVPTRPGDPPLDRRRAARRPTPHLDPRRVLEHDRRSRRGGPGHEPQARRGRGTRDRPGRERPFTVRGVWVVRASARNRALVARYPEVFAARFPGSSARWVAALTAGAEPPPEPGLVWCDIGATRLFAWRRG